MIRSQTRVLIALAAAALISVAVQWVQNQRLRGELTEVRSQPPSAISPRFDLAKETATGSAADSTLLSLDWRRIESTDYKEYIANLQKIGVPWVTIKDIIAAEVNRSYSQQARALGPASNFHYWETSGATSEQQETARRSKLAALEAERKALLNDLIGLEAIEESRERVALYDVNAPRLDFLSLEKRGVVDALSTYDLRRGQILQRPGGILLKEDFEMLKRLEAEKRSLLGNLLTPAELEQYDLTMHPTAEAMRTSLGSFAPTAQEFREVFAIRRAVDEKIEELKLQAQSDPAAPPVGLQMASIFNEAEQQIQSALGPGRYADYKRAEDPNFLILQRVSQEIGLPENAILQAYEVEKNFEKQQAEVERQIKQAGPPTAALKAWVESKLLTLQQGRETALRQALGTQGFEYYANNPREGRSAPPAVPGK
jgi:hypothetical protein